MARDKYGCARKKTGGKPPRGELVELTDTLAAPVSADMDEDVSDISETTEEGEAASADGGAPADKGPCTHHAEAKSQWTASGAYRVTSPAPSSAPHPAGNHAAAAKPGWAAPAVTGEQRELRRGRQAPHSAESPGAAAKSRWAAPQATGEQRMKWQRQGDVVNTPRSQHGGARSPGAARAAGGGGQAGAQQQRRCARGDKFFPVILAGHGGVVFSLEQFCGRSDSQRR